ncbi:cell cycle progression protein 1 isoform X2 [Bombina bombina]|uniref:cell cycle progression protein 1 isoform X2 n=1 Tax=Bombina bombina TaxID=8345 RepID=UPI00235AA37F|nr:cell cycle progression protein 1 isoform X2 [Bombina bombina]
MSENSSDSDSSCGWTIINHEGSDIETLNENGEACSDLSSLETHAFVQEFSPNRLDQQDTCSNEEVVSSAENIQPVSGETLTVPEDLSCYNTSSVQEISLIHEPCCQEQKENMAGDGLSEGVSDDSDIVTLDPPKVDDVGTLEEEIIMEEEVENVGTVNMSSSSSSQYTFSQPETVFPSTHIVTESSNDEESEDSAPSLRRRRSKRSTVSGSESENRLSNLVPPPEPRTPMGWGSNLNKCIILSLVIAVSMGFGHFYGTIQIQDRQKEVEKIHENELNNMKDDLFQCQKVQEATVEYKEVFEQLTEDLTERPDVLSLKGRMDKVTKENQLLRQIHNELKLEADDLTTSLKTTEFEKKNLALENQHLKESLENKEQALSSLQEELRNLREQIRNLEKKGRGDLMLSENQKLKAHLKEERQKIRNFLSQKEILLTEAHMLRKELDNERRNTESLKEEIEKISNKRSSYPAQEDARGTQEIEYLKERLSQLEKKLNFEQQRSDLWERLYIEAKEEKEQLELGTLHESQEIPHTKGGKGKKAKNTIFNSVKDTFDAMKNSTKEFVRHHKEKIKQAKEAVNENLKKFSDSVKTTFRHFKDSTKNMFDKDHKQREERQEEVKKANTVRREYKTDAHAQYPNKETGSQDEYRDSQNEKHFENQHTWKKGCSSVFECAHQESISLFNKVLDPIRVEEFNDLIQTYLQEQVDNFRHWKELEKFINGFFQNGVFIHDQMLFTDFVNDVEDYLEDMGEYHKNNAGVFEDLDKFVYRHFFGSAYSTPYGPRKSENIPPYKDPEDYRHRKHEKKPHQHRYKREGRWHKHGRANGRHMANVEIDLGQMPFDPKY